MMQSWLALGACVVMLGGCAQFSSRQAFPEHYTLIDTPSPALQDAGTQEWDDATLQVARIAVAPWLQGTDLYYRLDYRHDNRIAAYAQSDWVTPPARLLEPMIRNALASGNAWRAVLGPTGPARTDFSLHVRLDDFSQVFTSPRQSYGALDATATLVDNRDGRAFAQKHFRIQTPAPTADAEGGVKALNRAAQQFIRGIEQWLRTTPLRQPQPSSPESH